MMGLAGTSVAAVTLDIPALGLKDGKDGCFYLMFLLLLQGLQVWVILHHDDAGCVAVAVDMLL